MVSSPSPPAAPNPYAVASAQTAANLTVAIGNSVLSNANVSAPNGTSNFAVTGSYTIADPQYDSSGNLTGTTNRTVPIFTQTIAYDATGQSIFNANRSAQLGLANLSVSQLSQLSSTLGTPYSGAGLPAMAQGPAAGTLTDTVSIPYAVQTTIGTADTSADRNNVTAALLTRATTIFTINRTARITQLANMGIFAGSEAYNNEMQIFDYQYTDSGYQALLAGGQEQTRQFQIYREQGYFFNQAQQQSFMQGMMVVDFGNNVALRRFAMLTNVADYVNTFRERLLQEQLAIRNQTLNETSTLLRGGQIAIPAFTGYKSGHIDATPLAESVYRSANIAEQNYQAKVAQQDAMIAGVASVAGGILGAPVTGGGSFGGNLLTNLLSGSKTS